MPETIVNKKPLTAFHLKLIALITMVIDHVAAVLLFPPVVNSLMRGIGRMAFPIYAFLIAEGCRYTRSREKYLLRLGLFALVSEIPFDLAFYPGVFRQLGLGMNFLQVTNVFYTMFLAVACIHIWETLRRQTRTIQLSALGAFAGALILLLVLRQSPWLWIFLAFAYLGCFLLACHVLAGRADGASAPGRLSNILAELPLLPVLLLAETIDCDYSGFGVLLIFLIYFMKSRRAQIAVLASGMILLYGLTPCLQLLYGYDLTLHSVLVVGFAMLAVVLVYFYNDQRGRNVKWAFYAAYPVHIAILAILAAALGL